MRQIFTKAQLVVLWISGVISSFLLFNYSEKQYLSLGAPTGEYYIDNFQGYILPIIIITVLFMVTLAPKKLR